MFPEGEQQVTIAFRHMYNPILPLLSVYLLKKAITPYYMTQLLGDARDPPTLLADESFRDMAVIGKHELN